MKVVVAVPCHEEEPGVGRTVTELSDELRSVGDGRIVVCVNGRAPRTSVAATQLAEVPGVQIRFLDRASKAAAWNVLRGEPADVTVFSDADVSIAPGSVSALVEAIGRSESALLAAGAQAPQAPDSFAARAATTPFRLGWGGVAGTLYAARTRWLPEMPEDVILDDAWLWAQASVAGENAIVRVPEAIARFRTPSSWRDLWRQRLRAEAGKRQLREWNLPLAPAPPGARPMEALRAYPPGEWPAVAALAATKLAAALWSRVRPAGWRPATSTKGR